MQGPALAIVVKGFPRLSETFVARELEALEARGIAFSLHALRRAGGDAKLVENRVRAAPQYLPEYLHDAPAEVARAYFAARRLPGFAAAWRAFRVDLRDEFARGRVRRFGQACVLAAQMPASVQHVHAHFAHSPSSVARYAAKLRGVSFSMSAHAKDIWTAPEWDLRRKLDDTAFVTVCNKAGFERLATLGERRKLHLIYHGLARELLAARAPGQVRDGSGEPVRIISIARAVEKKGLRRLVDALARLPREIAFRLDHFGGGDLLPELKQHARAAGLEARISWHGPRPHAEVIAALDRSDLFVLPAVIGSDGDRDGIPNAVQEAQARGVAVLASRAGGIEEVVSDGVSGELVAPGDVAALAAALEKLVRDPKRRTLLGEGGLARARREGDAEAGYDQIAALLNERMA